MLNYFKYLLNKPLKILWLIFVYAVLIGIESVLINSIENGEDIDKYIIFGVHIFILVVFCLATYHPYKEYKDGLR
jgi:hypothetical protein